MNYKQLDAWKVAMELVKVVYNLVKCFPKEELFALTQQTKRAAISIPANIAEGVGRNYKKDTIQFLHISRGSLYELETLLLIAFNAALLPEEKLMPVQQLLDKCLQVLNGLINYYEKSNLK